jgi:hypothetical protein
VILRSNECNRQSALSKKLVNRASAFKEILEFLEKEFPEQQRPYILIDVHPDNKTQILNIRSLIFPRRGPADSGNIIWPIVFVPKDKVSEMHTK